MGNKIQLFKINGDHSSALEIDNFKVNDIFKIIEIMGKP